MIIPGNKANAFCKNWKAVPLAKNKIYITAAIHRGGNRASWFLQQI